MLKKLILICLVIFDLFSAEQNIQVKIRLKTSEHYYSYKRMTNSGVITAERTEHQNLYTKQTYWVYSASISKPNEQPKTAKNDKDAQKIYSELEQEYQSFHIEEYDGPNCRIRLKY